MVGQVAEAISRRVHVMHLLAGIALAPLLIVQGLITRRRTPRLPEPAGPRHGTAGEGPHLRLLILGDSAAAGVGVGRQQDALSGQLATRLSDSFAVEWQLEATTGHRTADALERLETVPQEAFDAVVISLGVNDVTGLTSVAAWRRRQRDLRRKLATRYNDPLLVCCGLPPMHRFPALPRPLRWFLGNRAAHFSDVLKQDVGPEPHAHFLKLDFRQDAAAIAPDGFHPGAAAYSAWSEAVAELLLRELGLSLPAGTRRVRSVECTAPAEQD